MSRRARWLVCTFSLAALVAAGTAAGQAPDPQPQHGRELALHVCSACHVVAKDQQFSPLLNPPAPSFMQIANRPGTSTEALRRFITSTHWDEKTVPLKMPNPRLTEWETADVAGYIMSLRSR